MKTFYSSIKSNKLLASLMILLFAFVGPLVVNGQGSSANYQLRQEATGFKEHDSTSTNYQLKSVIGGVTAVTSTSTNYLVNQIRSWISSEEEEEEEGGGGGGGGGSGTFITGVRFTGRAYPLSRVDLLKDGQVIVSTVAGADAKFTISASGFNEGSHTFLIIGEDSNGYRSVPESFYVTLSTGSTTQIGGIFLAPTLSVDKKMVKKGDNIAIFGQTVPDGDVTISVNSPVELFRYTDSDSDGVFLYNFDTAPLNKGDHETKAKSTKDNEISNFGHKVGFKVGDVNILNDAGACPEKGDLNKDCRVNLVDFSIAAFWYKRPLSANFQVTETASLNGDAQINIVDFSIMAFYWTG